MKKLLFLVALILMGASQMRADEGMWLPSEILKKIKDNQYVITLEVKGKMLSSEKLAEKINDLGVKLDALDALSLAEKAGNSKAVNIVLMGRLSKLFDFTEEEWLTAIEQSVPEKFLELNKKAFEPVI